MRSDRSKEISEVLGYTFPRLHTGKCWYIDFKAYDPESGTLKRKKYMVRKQARKSAMKSEAAEMLQRLSEKLRKGWTPWADVKNIRGIILFDEMLDKYVSHITLSMRANSLRSYRSRVNVLREYMKSLSRPPVYCYQYSREFIVDFLDWIIEERGGNARTRNNYRQWCGVFADFLIERGCLDENPVSKIRNLKESEKIRQPLDETQMRRLTAYLRKHDRAMLLACMAEYYTFIRPNELRHVRISDISVSDQTVFIPAEVSKNGRDGKVSLNEEIIKLMIEEKTLERPGHWYVFGPELLPSPEQAPGDIFNKRFAKIRKILGFPKEIKFYSLKDTGIKDLGNSAGIVTARDQARHTDIATTNRYLQGRDRDAPEKAKHFRGSILATEEDPLQEG